MLKSQFWIGWELENSSSGQPSNSKSHRQVSQTKKTKVTMQRKRRKLGGTLEEKSLGGNGSSVTDWVAGQMGSLPPWGSVTHPVMPAEAPLGPPDSVKGRVLCSVSVLKAVSLSEGVTWTYCWLTSTVPSAFFFLFIWNLKIHQKTLNTLVLISQLYQWSALGQFFFFLVVVVFSHTFKICLALVFW